MKIQVAIRFACVSELLYVYFSKLLKMSDNASKHNQGIDFLRGLSILWVVFLHVHIRVPFDDTYIGSIMPSWLYKSIFTTGFYGVCIFFVVSGFLITSSSIDRWGTLPKMKLKQFYAMRFARIIPLLLALILVISILHLCHVEGYVIAPQKTSLLRAVVAALTFHINWLEIQVGYLPASWDVLWSLSIEEVFYFFFPILCIITKSEKVFICSLLGLFILSPYARVAFYEGNEIGDTNHFAYLDNIAMGCIAAIISKRVAFSKRNINIAGVVGWALFCLVIFGRYWVYKSRLTELGLNVTILSVGTALILINMQYRHIHGMCQLPVKTGFMQFLGRNSYEIYLTHMFVVLTLVSLFETNELSETWIWVLYPASLVLSGILGSLVARYFSSPVNRFLRSRLISK